MDGDQNPYQGTLLKGSDGSPPVHPRGAWTGSEPLSGYTFEGLRWQSPCASERGVDGGQNPYQGTLLKCSDGSHPVHPKVEWAGVRTLIRVPGASEIHKIGSYYKNTTTISPELPGGSLGPARPTKLVLIMRVQPPSLQRSLGARWGQPNPQNQLLE